MSAEVQRDALAILSLPVLARLRMRPGPDTRARVDRILEQHDDDPDEAMAAARLVFRTRGARRG